MSHAFEWKKEYKLGFTEIDFLEDWMIGHFTGTDREYVDCFKEGGVK